MTHPLITPCLLGVAVTLCLLCAIGLVVMRDAYQRLQFASPVVSLAMSLIVVAIWIEDPQWQSRLKAALIALILFMMNGILSHATARAIRIREVGHLEPRVEEELPLVKDHGIAGERAEP